MTGLNLIRIPIATQHLARWAAERGLGWIQRRSSTVGFDEGRALHHLIGEVFGPDALGPFRLLVPPRMTTGNLYAYSMLEAGALRDTAAVQAMPDHLNVLRLDGLASKSMPDAWRAGQRLGFDLRTRPVRRLRGDLETPAGRVSKGKEIDAYLLEALRHHPEVRDGMIRENRSREAVYLDWLAERLGSGAELDRHASRLARFRRVRVARGNASSEGPDATFHGTLTVTDPTSFAALLARGVGRHRAYGYGMLLLRPPNRPEPER